MSALGAFSSALALDIILALCGVLDAAERTPGKLRLSCESALGLSAVTAALIAAVIPTGLAPLAFWITAAAVATMVIRALR